MPYLIDTDWMIDRLDDVPEAAALLERSAGRYPAPPTLQISRPPLRVDTAYPQASRKRVNRRALDLIIAATAIEHGLTLVTRNLDDYADIAELSLYQSTS